MEHQPEKMASVFIIAYNHEPYIRQTLDNIIAQKVNFDYEIVIGEDYSPDNTRKVCEEYAEKYPHLINLLPSDKNYGVMGNTIRTLEACTGKYIALCEGDDYWCDALKLQKQIDFLEANPDFTICFTDVLIKDEMGWDKPDDNYFPKHEKDVYTIEDFILSEMNIIPTPSLVLKNVLPRPLPDFYRNTLVGDMGLQLFASDKGKAKRLDEKMAVYRNHSGGFSKTEEARQKADAALMKFYEEFNEFTERRYDPIFHKRFLENAKMRLIFGAAGKKGMERVKHYFKRMPRYLKYRDKRNIKELLYYHYVLLFPFLLRKEE